MNRKVITLVLAVILILSVGILASAKENAVQIINDVLSEYSTISIENSLEYFSSYEPLHQLTDSERAEIESRNEELDRAAYEKAGKEYPFDRIEESIDVSIDEITKNYTQREKSLYYMGLPIDTRRITIEEVYDIVANSNSYAEFIYKINEIHGCYDCITGSGIMRTEYWLDDEGYTVLSVNRFFGIALYIQNNTEDEHILIDDFDEFEDHIRNQIDYVR